MKNNATPALVPSPATCQDCGSTEHATNAFKNYYGDLCSEYLMWQALPSLKATWTK